VQIYNRIYPHFERLYRSLGKNFDDVAELQRTLEK